MKLRNSTGNWRPDWAATHQLSDYSSTGTICRVSWLAVIYASRFLNSLEEKTQ